MTDTIKGYERPDIYGGADPREIPMYSYAAASRYLRVPPSTVSWWVKGRAAEGYEPVLTVEGEKGLSFHDLVELHALRRLRTVHRVKLSSIRIALSYSERKLGIRRLLLRDDLRTDGGDLFIDHLGHLVSLSKSGQIAIKKILELFLERVKRGDDRLPSQFFPDFSGAVLVEDRKPVSINPRIAFGRPTMAGTRVHTAVVADRVNAGEDLETIARDYNVTIRMVESAVSYETAA